MDWTFVRETETEGVVEYPFDLADLRAAGIAVHARTDPRSLAKHGVYHVHTRGRADAPVGYRAVLPDQPEKVGQFWVREYALEPLPVDDARADAHAALLTWANEFLGQFTAGYLEIEPVAWTKQEAAAEAYEDGNATQRQIAMLENEAAARNDGTTVPDLVARILAKAEPFNAIREFASGLRSRTQAQIDAAQLEELQGILDAAKAEALAKAQEITGG